MENIFFDSWESTLRTFLITLMAYTILIVLLRTSGKRTLSKMNAFDMIITIALGSTLANVTLNKQVALLDGALAFGLLVYLQYLITWLSTRSEAVQDLIKSTPSLLVYKGRMDREQMKKERITVEEIREAARQHGCSSMDELKAVILETTGDLNVIKDISNGSDEVLKEVRNFPR